MANTPSAWDAKVDDRIDIIAKRLVDNDFSAEVPGLKSLLDDYLDPHVDVKDFDFHRRLLAVFRESKTDNTYQSLLDMHTKDEKKRLEKFVDGGDPEKVSRGFSVGPSLGCREEMHKMRASTPVKISASGVTHGTKGTEGNELKRKDGLFHEFVHGLAQLFHPREDKDVITVYKDTPFQNWGLNVANTPLYTCIPTTTADVIRIVKYAKHHNMSVRCSGFRHSWSPIFGKNGQILISMLRLGTASCLPNVTALPLHQSPPTELESIDIVPGTPLQKGNSLVRIGCAVTNERLRRWCIKNNKVTIPLNVIMVEITLGGSNAPICHGAGRRHKTLSDLVRRIEFVDANGKLQSVDKVEHLRAASGCFGLMGVVTHLTLEFPPMTYAEMAPAKVPVMRAIPPPPDMKDEEIPKALLIELTPEERKKDQENFERHATNDYYAEWFWFPFSDNAWVNCWNDTTDPSAVVDFPDDTHIFLSFAQTFTMNVLQSTPLLSKLIQAVQLSEAAVTLISRAAMYALPDKPVKTYVTDALHFQRAIQNVRVRDVEVEIPLLPKSGQPDVPDFAVVQRAWWDAILKVYAHNKTCPMRMPLEMRIMGGSDVIMAPQRYNTLGTCSIEVLTLHSQADIWPPFAQEVLDKWMSYTDASGKRINTRPHWAKEWKNYKVDGKPWADKLKSETYSKEIEEFTTVLEAIGREQGWMLTDLKARFSNDFFDDFFFDKL